jgi:sec-independent protein translocase protein TatA
VITNIPGSEPDQEAAMFGLGTSELVIILVIVLLLFGAKRLPELGRGLGKGMRSFRDGLRANETDAINPPEISDKKS